MMICMRARKLSPIWIQFFAGFIAGFQLQNPAAAFSPCGRCQSLSVYEKSTAGLQAKDCIDGRMPRFLCSRPHVQMVHGEGNHDSNSREPLWKKYLREGSARKKPSPPPISSDKTTINPWLPRSTTAMPSSRSTPGNNVWLPPKPRDIVQRPEPSSSSAWLPRSRVVDGSSYLPKSRQLGHQHADEKENSIQSRNIGKTVRGTDRNRQIGNPDCQSIYALGFASLRSSFSVVLRMYWHAL